MTRRSKRELERALDNIEDENRNYGVSDLMWADLKDYYDGRLSPGEQRLIADPETHLAPAALSQINPARFQHGENHDTTE